MTVRDSFAWHTNALKGLRGPISEGEPQSGFYRQKRKDGTYEPIAYWKDSATGEQRCHINGRQPDELRALEAWPYASKHPISAEAYWAFIDTRKWNDNDQSAHDIAKGPEIDPEADPVGSMEAEIKTALVGVPQYKGIESDEQAARGQSLRSALTSLSGKADKIRVAEKEPHLQMSRDVDAKYMPLVKLAKQGADDIRTELGKWEDQKREAQRKAQADADRKARDHAEAVRKAEEANQPPPPPPPPPVAPNIPAPVAQIKGGSGRTASVTVANIVTDIDLDKCFAKFRTAPELRELFMGLADRSMKAGICTAEDVGAVIEQKSVVR
jgi:hypothetical protein